jgi:ferritin-like metal-binding protein YciE
MTLANFEKLLVHELKDLYSAENQLTKALPKMAAAANSPKLRDAFNKHLQETEQHIARIEQCFEQLEGSPSGLACKGMQGLIAEGEELIKEKQSADPNVFDAALICAAQKIEHYEIASYGTVRTLALSLGLNDVAKLLQTTLDNEGQTDQLLTELAIYDINIKVQAAGASS